MKKLFAIVDWYLFWLCTIAEFIVTAIVFIAVITGILLLLTAFLTYTFSQL